MAKDGKAPGQTSSIPAAPTKRFFTEMLTRDIELQDALLDLLDNCVDGILRSTKPRDLGKEDRPYAGYWAKIIFNEKKFQIADNCGGIPLVLARKYAFMMGRPRDEGDSDIPTVGMYGIGMKRAIFKMGLSGRVTSQTKSEAFEVDISKGWMADDRNWNLPLRFVKPPLKEPGVVINVEDLRPTVSQTFSKVGSSFSDTFTSLVAQHYGFIINKGFKVSVNGVDVKPVPMSLLWDTKDSGKDGLAPYLYSASLDGVDIRLAVGFYDQMLSEDEVEEAQISKRSTEDAGWTVICNDRVVVHNDKSRITGWGEAGVPSYHTQFVGISGVVYFQSNDAWKLPITTTKRGLDTSSEIYLYVKDFMREGLKKFTTYTNTWKRDLKRERTISSKAERVPVSTLLAIKPDKSWTRVKNRPNEAKLNLPLPMPPSTSNSKQIRFTKPIKEIQLVSEFLFGEADIEPATVGEECFNKTLKQAKK